jgi:hypothetical protein
MAERAVLLAPLLFALFPLVACTAVRRAPTPLPAPASPKPDHSARIRLLYDQGVDAYAQGDMPRAKTLFESILKLDPTHAPSQRALRRIRLER